eukprot:365072-Chlamydomonas_euryale.AAC.13
MPPGLLHSISDCLAAALPRHAEYSAAYKAIRDLKCLPCCCTCAEPSATSDSYEFEVEDELDVDVVDDDEDYILAMVRGVVQCRVAVCVFTQAVWIVHTSSQWCGGVREQCGVFTPARNGAVMRWCSVGCLHQLAMVRWCGGAVWGVHTSSRRCSDAGEQCGVFTPARNGAVRQCGVLTPAAEALWWPRVKDPVGGPGCGLPLLIISSTGWQQRTGPAAQPGGSKPSSLPSEPAAPLQSGKAAPAANGGDDGDDDGGGDSGLSTSNISAGRLRPLRNKMRKSGDVSGDFPVNDRSGGLSGELSSGAVAGGSNALAQPPGGWHG